eukprot:TRINITY_DN11221_c2_g2_i2.p1 TRINITY_DN11221_c2_g2~~TRINITY_DN11221_c2_g2_i2.p1  ORF type:complete len:364 (+),score=79.83 TRINITY_DN11221_c2_g2_i2:569-1660(+)
MIERGTDPPQVASRAAVPLSSLPPLVPQHSAPAQPVQLPRAAPRAAPPTDLTTAKKLLRDGAAFARAFECRNLASSDMPSNWQRRQEDVAAAAAAAAAAAKQQRSTQQQQQSPQQQQQHDGTGTPTHTHSDPTPSVRTPHAAMRDSLRMSSGTLQYAGRSRSVPQTHEFGDADDVKQVRDLTTFVQVAGQIPEHQGGWMRERRELHRRLALLDSQLKDKQKEASELKAALAARDATGGTDLGAARVRQQLTALRHDLALTRQTAQGQISQQDSAAAELHLAHVQLNEALQRSVSRPPQVEAPRPSTPTSGGADELPPARQPAATQLQPPPAAAAAAALAPAAAAVPAPAPAPAQLESFRGHAA